MRFATSSFHTNASRAIAIKLDAAEIGDSQRKMVEMDQQDICSRQAKSSNSFFSVKMLFHQCLSCTHVIFLNLK